MKLILFAFVAILNSIHSFNFKIGSRATITGNKIENIYRFGKSPEAVLRTSRCDEYAESVLTKPRWGGRYLGPIVRYLNIALVASIFSFILRIMNKFRAFNKEKLFNHVWNRTSDRGLLTVSNHQSVMDDPGLLSALLPWWRIRPELMRWTICKLLSDLFQIYLSANAYSKFIALSINDLKGTEDIFFANKYLSKILAGGNTLPLDRSGSLEQPIFRKFNEKLCTGSWCHIFAEGRVWQGWRFDEDGICGLVLNNNKFNILYLPDNRSSARKIQIRGWEIDISLQKMPNHRSFLSQRSIFSNHYDKLIW